MKLMVKFRFMDHKTVSSISMYEEKAVMDRQISRYWWALKDDSCWYWSSER
jgi:hypothetical protein